MLFVYFEWYCHFHLNRPGKDFNLDTEFTQRQHHFAVEVSDRHRFQGKCSIRSLRRCYAQEVLDEIEVDCKREIAIGNGGRCQATRRNVQRRTPAMVDIRGEHQPDFPRDLGPHVNRRAGILPICQRRQHGQIDP